MSRVFNPDRVTSAQNALTASGQRLRRRDHQDAGRLYQPWQARSFFYYDNVGEIKYAAQFYARMLAPLELYAAEIILDPTTGRPEVRPTDNPVANAHLERIKDPGGGRTGLLGAYGRLMFLTGEALLFVTLNPDSGEEQWEMLSTDELRVDAGGSYQRIKAPALGVELYREPADDDYAPIDDERAVAYRLWRRHPRYSQLADSPMQAVLDVAEELLLLTHGVRARVRSRLAGSGILVIDDRVAPAPLEPVPDEDANEDVFVRDLIEAMTRPITDEGAASAVVPLVVRVSVPEGRSVDDLIRHIQIVDPTQLYPETGLREEAVKRLAIGLDMPPEVLLGYAAANHWSSWLIDDQTWKDHGQPVAQQLVEDLSSAYYRPTLKDAGVEGWERFCIAYDASGVVSHPNKAKDAKDLYDRRAIGKASLRAATNFDEDDAMPEEELSEAIGIAVRDGTLATTGVAYEPAPGVPRTAGPPVAAPPAAGGSSEETAKGSPPVPAAAVASANGSTYRLLGAAEAGLLRAREAAGNRIVSLAKRDVEARELVRNVRTGQVAATLGRDRVRALGAPPERELVAAARGLIVDALVRSGIPDEDAAGRAADLIEQHAARTLYEERPARLPPAFQNYLQGLLLTPS